MPNFKVLFFQEMTLEVYLSPIHISNDSRFFTLCFSQFLWYFLHFMNYSWYFKNYEAHSTPPCSLLSVPLFICFILTFLSAFSPSILSFEISLSYWQSTINSEICVPLYYYGPTWILRAFLIFIFALSTSPYLCWGAYGI